MVSVFRSWRKPRITPFFAKTVEKGGLTMLFNKKIEPSCAYCSHGARVDDDSVICDRKGIVRPWGKCFRFDYDPLKRVPDAPVAPSTAGLSEDDFKL